MTATVQQSKRTNFLNALPAELTFGILQRLDSKSLRTLSLVSHQAYDFVEMEQRLGVAKWIGVGVPDLPALPEETSWTRLRGGISNMNEHKKRNAGDVPSMLVASKYLDPLFEQGIADWLTNIPVGKETQYSTAAERMRAMKRRVDEGHVATQSSAHESNFRRLQRMWGNRPSQSQLDEEERYRLMETLDLSNLDLETLPKVIACLRNVMRVNLNNNAFDKIPLELYRLPVFELQIEHNNIDKLPEDFSRFSLLQLLAVTGNPFESLPLPASIKQMRLYSVAVSLGNSSMWMGVANLIGNTLTYRPRT